jgi:ubiquinone/menaquinone biosynthesis C-methylase UbiE
MVFSINQWHQRYIQQAQWSASLRAYIYSRVEMRPSTKILDVGCGTGVLEKELDDQFKTASVGLDISLRALDFARSYASETIYVAGDACSIPFASQSFDITQCHFVLLWLRDVHQALREMSRVTCDNGFVIALAEPDYGGRIDYPNALVQLGTWQTQALQEQGANPFIGRELRALFHEAGLTNIETGVMGGQWADTGLKIEFGLEWDVVCSDLSNNPAFMKQADQLKQIDQRTRDAGQRILFVPTFYAIGQVS